MDAEVHESETVGITWAAMGIGLANIVYNMRRFFFMERMSVSA